MIRANGATIQRAEPLLGTLSPRGGLTWFTWALHEAPDYKAAEFCPEVNIAHEVLMGTHNSENIARRQALAMQGGELPGRQLGILRSSMPGDGTRAPHGKDVIQSYESIGGGPVDRPRTDREWMALKKSHAENMLELLQQFAPNMTWDNVMGYDPQTPFDMYREAFQIYPFTSPRYSRLMGSATPLREIANHRFPWIKNFYATGPAWRSSYMGGASCTQGYTCYKAIAAYFDLNKPWEGRLL